MNKGTVGDRLELAVYVLFFASSCYYVIGSIGLGVGDLAKPGIGFYPFMVALLLFFSSAVVVTSTFQRVGWHLQKAIDTWNRSKIINLSMLFVSFLIYLLTVHWVGFLLSTFWLVAFALWRSGDHQLVRLLVTAGLVSSIVDALFVVLFNVQLPKGILYI